jgi:hypothetical protein
MSSLNKLKIRLVVVCITILLLGISGMITNVSGDESEEGVDNSVGSRARASATEIPDYLTLVDNYGSPFDGVYGEGEPTYSTYFYAGTTYSSFYVYLKNIYNGNYLQNVNTTLMKDSDVGSYIKITQATANDNYISSGNTGSFRFSFEVSREVIITSFSFTIKVIFTAVDNQYNEHQESGYIYIKIKLSSRVESYGNELKLTARDKYGYDIPLYSGAKNQKIGLSGLSSADGTLENVNFNIYLSSFSLESNSVSLDQLSEYYSEYVEWILKDAGQIDTAPNEYFGTVDISYDLYSNTMKEKQTPISIEIDETPIVSLSDQIDEDDIGSMDSGVYNSNVQIYQGSTTENLGLKFRNGGNVDLKNVEVELYTDNAAFFFKSNFYYDESSQAQKRSFGKSVFFGDIGPGQTVTKDFSTEIIKNLPPGLYKIPIKYSAEYTQEDTTLRKINEYDYHVTITSQRSINDEGFTPFLLVNVIEGEDANDQMEPDLVVFSETEMKPGMKNVLLTVECTNLENYRLNDLNAKISAGGLSPLQKLNEEDRAATEVEAQEKDLTLYGANEAGYSNKETIHFMVDVFKDATAGLHNVPITFTCLDSFNIERTVTVDVALNVIPNPPILVISDASTDKIEPNDNFKLNLKVYNCGSEAKSVRVMFNGSTNQFSAVQSIQGPKSIKKNEEMIFTFDIKAGDIDPGNTYTLSVFFDYEDASGNSYPFDSSTENKLSIRAKKPEPDTWNVDEGFGLVILSLFILFSAIIFGVLRARIAKKEHIKEESTTGRAAPQTQPPATEKKGKFGFGRKREKKSKPVDMTRRNKPQQTAPPTQAQAASQQVYSPTPEYQPQPSTQPTYSDGYGGRDGYQSQQPAPQQQTYSQGYGDSYQTQYPPRQPAPQRQPQPTQRYPQQQRPPQQDANYY